MKIESLFNQPKSTAWACLLIAVVCAAAAGCASKSVNPSHASTHNGYVDIYSDESDLYWKVERVDSNGKAKTVFQQYSPLDEPVLRLEFAPGPHHLRISFLNRVVSKPADVELLVQSGQVTPVRIKFNEASTVVVLSKQSYVGGTAYGRYGRRTNIEGDETMMYDITAQAGSPLAFQARDNMSYAGQ
jgi:hypothetical protein